MTTWQIVWLGFAGLEVILLIIAFATGRAFYSFPLLFEDRSMNPFGFWLAVVSSVAVLAIAVGFAIGVRW
jgi:hypothetical protein